MLKINSKDNRTTLLIQQQKPPELLLKDLLFHEIEVFSIRDFSRTRMF